MIIIAIDLGKFNSMVCIYETTTQTYSLETVTSERSYLTSLLKHHQPKEVVVEACGPSVG